MHTLHFFAGGNTCRGFHSCFDSILPPDSRKRMYFIKGGPGVGKSTLMRQFAAAAQAKGQEVCYYHCSSDPDSLDGISLPRLGIGMMDGTAPHVYDPSVPGARDTLISLGDLLDEDALSAHTGEIRRIQTDISARFARCYRYLAAAEEVFVASAIPEDEDKSARVADEWVKSLPLRGGRGQVRQLFASAFTPKGRIDALDTGCFERRITLDCPFGARPAALMRTLSCRAAARGLDVVELLDALNPGCVSHVLIPAHGVAFLSGQRTAHSAGEWLDAQEVFDLSHVNEKEDGFDRNAFELLTQRAVEQLTAAKALHDDLEAIYVKHMDFLRWQDVLDQLVAAHL